MEILRCHWTNLNLDTASTNQNRGTVCCWWWRWRPLRSTPRWPDPTNFQLLVPQINSGYSSGCSSLKKHLGHPERIVGPGALAGFQRGPAKPFRHLYKEKQTNSLWDLLSLVYNRYNRFNWPLSPVCQLQQARTQVHVGGPLDGNKARCRRIIPEG